jgi:AcrR family transcriptional regulator
MPRPGNKRYHHGDLRAALIETAAELIAERGMRGFSLAEASRRLGVAVSAPYAHFADRDDLLAAVAVRAFELIYAALVPAMDQFSEPADRLAAMARAYVLFAAGNRPMFEMLYESGLDKTRHPEIEAAERPLNEAFEGCVRALCLRGHRARPCHAAARRRGGSGPEGRGRRRRARRARHPRPGRKPFAAGPSSRPGVQK